MQTLHSFQQRSLNKIQRIFNLFRVVAFIQKNRILEHNSFNQLTQPTKKSGMMSDASKPFKTTGQKENYFRNKISTKKQFALLSGYISIYAFDHLTRFYFKLNKRTDPCKLLSVQVCLYVSRTVHGRTPNIKEFNCEI